ncbi:hypothetical protein PM082_000078 [Marasmius tenuissimus]|nr:hypothetical protein PM082_000078 [Marasmius tenuissimus]
MLSSEEEKGPDTPGDSDSLPAIIEVVGDAEKTGTTILGAVPSLTYEPTPFNFARRRWKSLSRTPTEERQEPPPEFDVEYIEQPIAAQSSQDQIYSSQRWSAAECPFRSP